MLIILLLLYCQYRYCATVSTFYLSAAASYTLLLIFADRVETERPAEAEKGLRSDELRGRPEPFLPWVLGSREMKDCSRRLWHMVE